MVTPTPANQSGRLTKIGDQVYFKGADDTLMPTRKGQPPPDLRYFKQPQR